MDYNFLIPDIYDCGKINNTEKKYDIKVITLHIIPNIHHDLDEELNLINNKQNNKQYDNDVQYDDVKRIYAFYFKTKTNKIILNINGNVINIHNNFLYLNTTNRRTDNDYRLYNISDIDQYIEIYIIYKNNHRIELVSVAGGFYYKTKSEKCHNLFYANKNYLCKYYAPYNDAMQTYDIMLNFYVKTRNNELNDLICFESNNIIFYFKYNYKSKFTNTQYIYKYNLIKLQNKITDMQYICELNDSKLHNISSVENYLDNIDNIYNEIYDILTFPIHINRDSYFLDFNTFMNKNNVDELYYNKISYDV